MPKLEVPPLDEIVDKWVEEAPKRAPYYEKKTPAAGDRWQERATAAAGTYKSAVTAVDIDKRFKGGIKRVGAAKFVRKVKAVGVARFGPGVEAAKEDMRSGFEPYQAELAVIDIPERKPRDDPANYARVKAIGDPLHKKRLAILAALPA